MPVVIFKEASCKLKTSNGLYLLKGNYELNIIDEATLKELRTYNPEFDIWIEKGYVTLNAKEDNVKADGLLMQEKQAKEKLIEAEEQAKQIITEAEKQAEEIRRQAESIAITDNKEDIEETPNPSVENKKGKK